MTDRALRGAAVLFGAVFAALIVFAFLAVVLGYGIAALAR